MNDDKPHEQCPQPGRIGDPDAPTDRRISDETESVKDSDRLVRPLASLAEASTELAHTHAPPPPVDSQDRLAKLSELQASGGIGNYNVIEELGSGGFGTVFRARDVQLDREVAVKIIKSASTPNRSRMIQQFQEEARAAAQLRHPNIVPVHHSGEFAEDEAFIVFDFIPGTTLRRVLRSKGPLAVDHAVSLLAKVADALGYAHARGVVHLDVKPENILIEEETNEPHVADFGCAKREYRTEQLVGDGKGRRIGTPSYFSPEQARGSIDESDARSDVWALGIMLDELITGRRTFRDQEPDREQLYEAICHRDPPSLRERCRDVDRDLNAIWHRCLQKNPANRYPTGKQLTADLQRWMNGQPVEARSIGLLERMTRWARRNPGMATAVSSAFLAVTLGLIVSLFFWGRELKAKRNLVTAQITRLMDANPDGVGEILHALEEDHLQETTINTLRDRWLQLAVRPDVSAPSDKPAPGAERRRVALALNRFQDRLRNQQLSDQLRDCLIQSALDVEPREQWLIHENLRGDSALLLERFQSVADDSSESPRRRLRAVCGALFHATDTTDRSLAVTPELRIECLTWLRDEVNAVGRFDPEWVRLLHPLREVLRQPLESTLAADQGTPQRQEADMLFGFFQDDPEYLAQQLFRVDDVHVSDLLVRLRAGRDEQSHGSRLPGIIQRNAETALADNPSAKRRSNIMARLLAAELEVAGQTSVTQVMETVEGGARFVSPTTVWTVFCAKADDLGVSRKQLLTLADRAVEGEHAAILRYALLALGEFASAGVDRRVTAEWLHEIWRDHPDSGVHFSCDWLIRRWKLDALLELSGPSGAYVDGRGWRYDGSRPMVRVAPKAVEWVGSPDEELRRFSRSQPVHVDYEAQYRVRVDWDFEIAAHEVTVGDFRLFLETRVKEIERSIAALENSGVSDEEVERLYDALTGLDNLLLRLPNADDPPAVETSRAHAVESPYAHERLPVTDVSWYDTVMYCVWLSNRAGLDSCYGTLDQVELARQQIQSIQVDLQKNGYRLPTSVEWEIACRSGTTTPWFFGDRPEFASRYANCSQNSSLTIAPIGLFRPNPHGLFDTAGNASEWLTNVARPNPKSQLVRLPPIESATEGELNREIRGGNYIHPLGRLRSAAKSFLRPDGHDATIGIRLCRTLDLKN